MERDLPNLLPSLPPDQNPRHSVKSFALTVIAMLHFSKHVVILESRILESRNTVLKMTLSWMMYHIASICLNQRMLPELSLLFRVLPWKFAKMLF
jgi:hypothetical protein